MSLEKARVTSNYINEHNSYNNGEPSNSSPNHIDVESINDPVVFGGNLMPSSSSSQANSPASTSKPYSTNPKSLLAKPRQGYIAPSVTTRKRSKLS